MKLFSTNWPVTIIFLIFLLVGMMGCVHHQWNYNVQKNGIEFEKLRYSMSESDTLTIIGYLRHNEVIQGYPCQKGWVHFSKDFKLKLFCLSDSISFHEMMLPPQSWIILNPRIPYTTVVFPYDLTINGYPCKGGGGSKGVHTRFYPSGKLRSFWPTKNIIIDSIACRKSLIHSVKLHENGKLHSCQLAESVTVEGKTFARGDIIYFNESGNIWQPN